MTNILRYGVLSALFVSIFLSFSNIFFRLCQGCGYSHGLLSDYLIPKIYLVDISVVAAIALITLLLGKGFILQLLKKSIQWNGILSLLIACWLILGIYQLSTTNPLVGLLQWFRLTNYGLLATIIYVFSKNKYVSKYALLTKDIVPVVRLSVAIGIVFQAFVSMYQWIYQKHLFGYLLFGEPLLVGQSGLAKKIQDGAEYILPYGTTAHPNILGGLTALGLYFLVSVATDQKEKSLTGIKQIFLLATHSIVICAGLTIILISQSAAAALLIIFAGISLLIQHYFLENISNREQPKLLAFLFFTILVVWIGSAQATVWFGSNRTTEPSWHRRAYLIESTKELISQFSWNEIAGAGLGQFTAQAPQQLRAYESARFNQPVHHIPLLFLAETGILGLAIILILLLNVLQNTQLPFGSYSKENYKQLMQLGMYLIVLSPIMVWDHYLWSIPPASVLVVGIGVTLLLNTFTVTQSQDLLQQ